MWHRKAPSRSKYFLSFSKNNSSSFHGVQQVSLLGLENTTDIEIWRYAKKNNFAIVTFDADFSDFVSLFGHPPKIIWLRGGNKDYRRFSKF